MSIFKTPHEHPLAEAVLDKHVLGLNRAMHFADELVQQGKWTPEKAREAQRAGLQAYMDDMPMEMYARMRETGAFQQYHELTGNDGTRDVRQVQQDRRAALKELKGAALTEAWFASQIDDDAYVSQMKAEGLVPETTRKYLDLVETHAILGKKGLDEAIKPLIGKGIIKKLAELGDPAVEIALGPDGLDEEHPLEAASMETYAQVRKSRDPFMEEYRGSRSPEEREMAEYAEKRNAQAQAKRDDLQDSLRASRGLEPLPAVVSTKTVGAPSE